MDTLIPPRPSSYTEIMKQSFRLYRASFSKVIILSLILSLIIFTPRIIADILGQDVFLPVSVLNPYRFWLFMVNLLGMIFMIGIFWHMHCVLTGHQDPLVADISQGVKKLLLVILASFIEAAAVIAASLLITFTLIFLINHQLLSLQNPLGMFLAGVLFIAQFILILYVITLFMFLLPLIATENKGIFSGIGKSISLAWNHGWRVFSVQYTPWLSYIVLLMFIKFVLNIDVHIYFVEHTPHSILSTVLNLIIMTFFAPWVAALLIVQLNDLEMRKKILI